MGDSFSKVVWDSCVILDAIQKSGDYDLIEPYLRDAENGKLKIVVSEISVIEVSRLDDLASKGIDVVTQLQLIDDWFENEYVIRKPPIPGITDMALNVARNHNVRGNDAIIVATALFYRIPILHTGDGSSRKKGGKLIPLDRKIGEPPLRITKPNPFENTLFENREQEATKK